MSWSQSDIQLSDVFENYTNLVSHVQTICKSKQMDNLSHQNIKIPFTKNESLLLQGDDVFDYHKDFQNKQKCKLQTIDKNNPRSRKNGTQKTPQLKHQNQLADDQLVKYYYSFSNPNTREIYTTPQRVSDQPQRFIDSVFHDEITRNQSGVVGLKNKKSCEKPIVIASREISQLVYKTIDQSLHAQNPKQTQIQESNQGMKLLQVKQLFQNNSDRLNKTKHVRNVNLCHLGESKITLFSNKSSTAKEKTQKGSQQLKGFKIFLPKKQSFIQEFSKQISLTERHKNDSKIPMDYLTQKFFLAKKNTFHFNAASTTSGFNTDRPFDVNRATAQLKHKIYSAKFKADLKNIVNYKTIKSNPPSPNLKHTNSFKMNDIPQKYLLQSQYNKIRSINMINSQKAISCLKVSLSKNMDSTFNNTELHYQQQPSLESSQIKQQNQREKIINDTKYNNLFSSQRSQKTDLLTKNQWLFGVQTSKSQVLENHLFSPNSTKMLASSKTPQPASHLKRFDFKLNLQLSRKQLLTPVIDLYNEHKNPLNNQKSQYSYNFLLNKDGGQQLSPVQRYPESARYRKYNGKLIRQGELLGENHQNIKLNKVLVQALKQR